MDIFRRVWHMGIVRTARIGYNPASLRLMSQLRLKSRSLEGDAAGRFDEDNCPIQVSKTAETPILRIFCLLRHQFFYRQPQRTEGKNQYREEQGHGYNFYHRGIRLFSLDRVYRYSCDMHCKVGAKTTI